MRKSSSDKSTSIMDAYSKVVHKVELAVEKVNWTVDGRQKTFFAIVLREKESHLIIKFTDYADYILFPVMLDVPVYRANSKYLCAVTQFLNYVFFTKRKLFRKNFLFLYLLAQMILLGHIRLSWNDVAY